MTKTFFCSSLAAASVLVGCASVPSTTRTEMSAVERIAEASEEIQADDFAAVLAAVGDARVVFLGEPSHGDGSAIAQRAALVRALHDQLGFDVLVFESDFFAVTQAWENFQSGGTLQAVRDNVQPFWSASAAAAPLWNYVEAEAASGDTLHVAAMDTQLFGPGSREALPGFLRRHLTALEGVDASDVEATVGLIALALGSDDADPSAMTDAAVLTVPRLLTRLEREAADPFAAQVGQSLYDNFTNGQNRDPGMGNNLLWLLTERYPGRKMIVWAHNNHVVMDKWAILGSSGGASETAQLSETELARWIYAGEVVRHALGPDATYSVATVPYSGRYSNEYDPALRYEDADFDQTGEVVPAPAGSVEAALAELPGGVRFVDLRPLRSGLDEAESRAVGFEAAGPLALRIADGWDGLLFIRESYGLNEVGTPAP